MTKKVSCTLQEASTMTVNMHKTDHDEIFETLYGGAFKLPELTNPNNIWSTTKNGNGVRYSAGDVITVTKSMDLYELIIYNGSSSLVLNPTQGGSNSLVLNSPQNDSNSLALNLPQKNELDLILHTGTKKQ